MWVRHRKEIRNLFTVANSYYQPSWYWNQIMSTETFPLLKKVRRRKSMENPEMSFVRLKENDNVDMLPAIPGRL